MSLGMPGCGGSPGPRMPQGLGQANGDSSGLPLPRFASSANDHGPRAGLRHALCSGRGSSDSEFCWLQRPGASAARGSADEASAWRLSSLGSDDTSEWGERPGGPLPHRGLAAFFGDRLAPVDDTVHLSDWARQQLRAGPLFTASLPAAPTRSPQQRPRGYEGSFPAAASAADGVSRASAGHPAGPINPPSFLWNHFTASPPSGLVGLPTASATGRVKHGLQEHVSPVDLYRGGLTSPPSLLPGALLPPVASGRDRHSPPPSTSAGHSTMVLAAAAPDGRKSDEHPGTPSAKQYGGLLLKRMDANPEAGKPPPAPGSIMVLLRPPLSFGQDV
jgi:hypothetical protein